MTRWAVAVGRCWLVLWFAREDHAPRRKHGRPSMVAWLRSPSPRSVHWSRIAAVIRGKLGDSSLPPRMLN